MILRNLVMVNWQYWQTSSSDFFWIVCWDQTRSEQWSIVLHSRELLKDEHQYDGPHVHRWLPSNTKQDKTSYYLQHVSTECSTWCFARGLLFGRTDIHQSTNGRITLEKFKITVRSRLEWTYFMFHQWTNWWSVVFQCIGTLQRQISDTEIFHLAFDVLWMLHSRMGIIRILWPMIVEWDPIIERVISSVNWRLKNKLHCWLDVECLDEYFRESFGTIHNPLIHRHSSNLHHIAKQYQYNDVMHHNLGQFEMIYTNVLDQQHTLADRRMSKQ